MMRGVDGRNRPAADALRSFASEGAFDLTVLEMDVTSEQILGQLDVVLVEPCPFSTNFFDNLIGGADDERATAYAHVDAFGDRFREMVQGAFDDGDAPTDPGVVVDAFERLIETPPGKRPFRTIAGLDFGLQAVNDAVEPIRREALATMEVADWDGPALSG